MQDFVLESNIWENINGENWSCHQTYGRILRWGKKCPFSEHMGKYYVWKTFVLSVNVWGKFSWRKCLVFEHMANFDTGRIVNEYMGKILQWLLIEHMRKKSHLTIGKYHRERNGHPRKNADFFFFFIENTVADFHELW